MNTPIGIFDSGIGGTTIWREITQLLPYESTIYLADSRHAPYGQKSTQKIIDFSIKNVEFLLQKNCKLIVIACNTATTNAVDILRKHYPVPFVGIEPAIKPAALKSQTKSVGVLATQGTLSSKLFANTSELYASDIQVIEQVGEGLVELIESGHIDSEEMTILLKQYLKPMLEGNIDYLVLGCTHYPYLIPKIQSLIPAHIKIIDAGFAVARQTQKLLHQFHIANTVPNPAQHLFYCNNPDISPLQSFVPKQKVLFENF